MIRDGKYNSKCILLGVLIGCIVFLCLVNAEKVEAAESVYVPDWRTEVVDNASYIDASLDYNYCFVTLEGSSYIFYRYTFCNDYRVETYNGEYYLAPYDYQTHNVVQSTLKHVGYSYGVEKWCDVISAGDVYKCSKIVASNWDWRGGNADLMGYVAGGLSYPEVNPEIYLTVPWYGEDVKISMEDYEYYLILYGTRLMGDTRVFLSHEPLKGAMNGVGDVTIWGNSSIIKAYGTGNNTDLLNNYGMANSTTGYGNYYSSYHSNHDVKDASGNIILSANPIIDPSVPITSVNLNVNGMDYTVSEPFPFYLALKGLDGSVRLLFSDIPFTGGFVDLYNKEFSVRDSANVVSYYWDPKEQNDFLASRTVSIGYDSFLFKNEDYICNYPICDTNNLLNIFLPEKESFEDILTAKDLFSVMPDDLYFYNYCIVFRQDSPAAYDDRIIFYGWNESSANLYIKKKNSQIAALTSKSVVSDYVTAYYDPDFDTWVISDDIVLGATRDGSFNMPVIYHSDVDLFVCDEWRYWEYVGYMGDANRPIVSFDEPEEDEDDGLLSRLFNGLKNLLKNLFVPSSGFLNSKVGYMKSKFVFYESICDTINVIVDFFTETDYSEPPKFYINLSKSRSKYDYGDTAVCLDMSWYAEYKPAVDAFLSAVIWIVFAWNTFRNLPNIIAGIASGGNVTTTIIKGVQPPEPQASAISKNAMKEGTSYTRGL